MFRNEKGFFVDKRKKIGGQIYQIMSRVVFEPIFALSPLLQQLQQLYPQLLPAVITSSSQVESLLIPTPKVCQQLRIISSSSTSQPPLSAWSNAAAGGCDSSTIASGGDFGGSAAAGGYHQQGLFEWFGAAPKGAQLLLVVGAAAAVATAGFYLYSSVSSTFLSKLKIALRGGSGTPEVDLSTPPCSQTNRAPSISPHLELHPFAHVLCPITQEPIVSPVVVRTSGRVYEEKAIVEWLERSGTDPYTRQPTTVEDLIKIHW